MEELKVVVDGKEHIVRIEEDNNSLKVHLDGKIYNVETSLKNEQKDYGLDKSSSDESKTGSIKAGIPGIVFSVDVKPGQKVKKKQKLISLIAMKMENQILSPINGTVKKLNVKKNDKVNKGDTLIIIE
ncbi:MAG: biotin/lipoyl-binding protein [Nanoarchaeota archaeon]|nr:biotin/lipoyl-binding protein [Nanoarchaeota archaeon]